VQIRDLPGCPGDLGAQLRWVHDLGLGRFGNYVPPVLEVLGLAEVEHSARNNRMRAR
jgi:hypothetical protein